VKVCVHVCAPSPFLVCRSVLQCVAVCCSVLQCVSACCSVLQYVAVYCSVLQCVAVCCSAVEHTSKVVRCSAPQCALQWVTVFQRVQHLCTAECCSGLQSALQ